MPDYIYLLENRLSADQLHALRQLREAAREAGTLLFLTGDAVRDLTQGQAVRDLEVSVHGNALKLKKIVGKLGASVWGEDEPSHSLYLCFPGTVRVDLISTHRMEYPKPGKGIFHSASIQEDLRRRDFTVNAMAISLNEGSFGLLMDPLNGAADIEGRILRLVSNYGFIEEPALMIRATRYVARLGWELDPKTLVRYENAKGEGMIENLSSHARSQELEQIGHEEDGLKVLRALEAEGWMQTLFPAWTAAKADEEKLIALHALAAELRAEGVRADMSAAQMQLLTAGLTGREMGSLKKAMLRPGFVEEWSSLDAQAARFAKVLLAKENATPSAAYKLFASYDPEAVLWLGFTTRDAAVQERFNLFLKVWPETRQRIPHALLQEMRITPELPAYREIVQAVFLELIDGRLATPEETKAFLEPHSPPAPPPQVTIKRPRAKRGVEAKLKERSYDDEEEPEEALDEDLDDIGGDEEEIDLGLVLPKGELGTEMAEESEAGDDELEAEEPEPVPVAVKRGAKAPASPKPATEAVVPAAEVPQPGVKAAKPAVPAPPVKPAAPKPEKPAKPQPAAKPKPEPAPPQKAPLPASKKAAPAPAPTKRGKPAKPEQTPKQAATAKKPSGTPVKAPAKPPAKVPVKAPAKTPAKVPVKIPPKVPAKIPAKIPAKTPAKVPAKVPVKTPVKTPVKLQAKPASKVQAKIPAKAVSRKPVKPPAKSAGVKPGAPKPKPAPAPSPKAGKPQKGAKSAKPAGKKTAPKGAKKR